VSGSLHVLHPLLLHAFQAFDANKWHKQLSTNQAVMTRQSVWCRLHVANNPWVCCPRISCGCHCPQVFCQRHPDIAKHFMHAHGAIFTSATSSTLGCCNIGGHAAAAEAASKTHQSSSQPSVRIVNPSDAAATIYGTDKPRSITALLVDRSHGKTVKQRIKDKQFADISYIAELLLQLMPVLALLQQELGFTHDDLRLDNIIETSSSQGDQGTSGAGSTATAATAAAPAAHPTGATAPQQQQQQQQQQHSVHGSSSSPHALRGSDLASSHQEGHNTHKSESSSSSTGSSSSRQPTFTLFDFGLSMINPDKFSMGQQARASPADKRQALRRLQEQGGHLGGGFRAVHAVDEVVARGLFTQVSCEVDLRAQAAHTDLDVQRCQSRMLCSTYSASSLQLTAGLGHFQPPVDSVVSSMAWHNEQHWQ